jgi:hypothetical protein
MGLTKWQCGKCGLVTDGIYPTPQGPCPAAPTPENLNSAPVPSADPSNPFPGPFDHNWHPVTSAIQTGEIYETDDESEIDDIEGTSEGYDTDNPEDD